MVQVQAQVTFPKGKPTPVQIPKLYRVLHDYEIAQRQFSDPDHGQFWHPEEGWGWRNGMPEVFWLFGTQRVPFDDAWQKITFGLNTPGMTSKQFRVFCDDHRAFHNGTGFWTDATVYAEYVPHRDVINKLDLNDPPPDWDKVRVCGGMTLRGIAEGDMVKVETLDYDTPPLKLDGSPDLEWLEAHPWLFFHAVNTHVGAGNVPKISPFDQRGGLPCYMPLVAAGAVWFPLGALQEMDAIADPYKIFIT